VEIIQKNPIRLRLVPDVEIINMDCPMTWEFIQAGPKSLFQLETPLGRGLVKKACPTTIEELADVLAIIRPGCREAIMDNDKTITENYLLRKNGKAEVEYYHPALEPILNKTLGCLIYQESAMKIAVEIAGFTALEADSLRKAMGKKLVEKMAEMKAKFIDGCEKLGKVTRKEGEEIFSWIEKSQRYSFNKSHAVSYALNTYSTAYGKAHFTKAFTTSYLKHSESKPKPFDEVKSLVQDARLYGITVNPPNITRQYDTFKLVDAEIHFGLRNIRGVGKSVLTQLGRNIKKTTKELGRPIDQWSWLEFLILVGPYTKSDSLLAMINAGALSVFNIPRKRMEYEFKIYGDVSKNEKIWCQGHLSQYDDLLSLLQGLAAAPVGRHGGCPDKKRLGKVQGLIATLECPSYVLEDNAVTLEAEEIRLLGVALTCTAVDACEAHHANCNCKEFLDGEFPQGIINIAAAIDHVKEIRTKKGKGDLMAFLSISDISGNVDSVVVWPDKWETVKRDLARIDQSQVMLTGQRGRKKENFSSFYLEKMTPIE
jgi:DNA polymerase III alpha subunit